MALLVLGVGRRVEAEDEEAGLKGDPSSSEGKFVKRCEVDDQGSEDDNWSDLCACELR